ncbi:RND transporter [Massilia eurypsychrophila]|jgi:multidrug efflux system outer membrane protein|uniref:RND transporter n=1 Tax=Massilia eurypsychrophila TaxID=1485217 RepID=A0A2G8TD04_9BURK|nr:efflux transporter outer membrane subunit [Massilia eurypsychrophila]PIL43538.1 RND transporter [Massilia eurypsychrophila]
MFNEPSATRGFTRQRCSPIARTVLAGLAVAGALGGCAVMTPAPPPAVDLAIPPQWIVAGRAAPVTPLAAWWRRYDDPLLVRLVDDALGRNPSILGARAALAQSRAAAAVQSAARLPVLSGSASAQRNHAGDADSSSFRTGFDASWELDVFGAQRAAMLAVDANTRASAASLADIQVSVAAEVAINYLNLRGLQAQLAISQASLRSQEKTLELTGWRVQAGLLTVLEMDQSRAATEQTRSRIPALQTAAAQAQYSLAVLTGRAPAALVTALAAAPATALTEPAELAIAIPAATLRQRPDVRAAEERVAAAAALVTQADAARLPDFSLGGSLGLNALTAAALPNGASVVATLLARVTAPLFDGGAGKARVRAQQAQLEQAGAAYAGIVLGALQDVEDEMVALRNERNRLASLRIAAAAAANAALLASQRYSAGLVDFQVVLETERTSLNTQDAVAASTTDLLADHVRLYKALGGGWGSDTPILFPAPKGVTFRETPP